LRATTLTLLLLRQLQVAAARKVLEEGLPEGALLNINIPAGEIKGVKVTRRE
jgi:broad specificity polyphosphatase/5'/3'-nucleotidase SurE